MTDLVTVLLLANNRPEFLERAILSVLKQDHEELELLIVQDSDNEVVREIAGAAVSTDGRVRYWKREKRGNIAEASNWGVRKGSGEYIAIIDDDDFWLTNRKLGMQLQFLREHPDHIALGGGVVLVNPRP